MKRIISLAMACLFMLILVGCSAKQDTYVVDIDVPQEVVVPTEASASDPAPEPSQEPSDEPSQEPTQVPTEVPTQQPTDAPTQQPTAIPTQQPTQQPTTPPSGDDQSVFDDAVFIGNSIFEGLYRFGIITHGVFLTKVGLNVNSIYTDPPSSGGSKPIIDELTGSNYKKVIINLGLNEVGWPSQETFISRYTNIINDIKTRVPGAKIYVVAMTPVTKKYSNSTGAGNGINIKNIKRTNGMIESMCASTGVVFVPNPDDLFDSEGYLPADASSDGVHMNLQYDRLWAAHIAAWVKAH